MPEKNPMENLIGNDSQPSIKNEENNEESKNEDLEVLKESVTVLGENLQILNDKLSGIEEKIVTSSSSQEEKEEEESWVPKSWGEVKETIEQTAEEKAEAKLKAREEEFKQTREVEEKYRKEINDDFDKQIASMEKEGLIPAIKEVDNPDDLGRAVRREIFAYAHKLNTTNLKEVGEHLKREHEAGFVYDYRTKKFIKTKTSGYGQQVPVGSSSSQGIGLRAPIDYKTLHNTSMDELIRRSNEN